MQENLGFGIIAEVPCVIVDVMRGGPSTGLPTMPSQSDVMQARWGTHGDHPIIVLSASTVRECFDMTIQAFNLSEKFRTPVILLIDEVVGHMREKMALPNAGEIEIFNRVKPTMPPEWYIPFEDSPRGVPPMANFGEGYRYHVTGLTHDIRGSPPRGRMRSALSFPDFIERSASIFRRFIWLNSTKQRTRKLRLLLTVLWLAQPREQRSWQGRKV